MFSTTANRFLAIAFVTLLWLPLGAMLLVTDRDMLVNEQRRLAPMPKFELDNPKEFTTRYENYYNDRFGLREYFIRWFHRLQIGLFDTSTGGSVLIGKDGWLFQTGTPHHDEMRNAWPFSVAELKRWAAVLQNKRDVLAERGIDYLFVIAPNKHRVYPEKLPDAIKFVDDTSRAEQLVEYLNDHTSVPVLFLRPHLLAAKENSRPYHKTDTHWNDWGAYLGYREILRHLLRSHPDLPMVRLTREDFVTRTEAGRDLARSLNLQDVLTEEVLVPKSWRPDCAKYYEVTKDGPRQEKFRKRFSTACTRGRGRLLMFRDSYSLDMMPYLSETFQYIHYYPASPVPLRGMLRVAEEQWPDIVIEERASRWLRTPSG